MLQDLKEGGNIFGVAVVSGRLWTVLMFGVAVMISSCSDGSDVAPAAASSTSTRSSPTRADQLVESTSIAPRGAADVALELAQAAVNDARSELPYPADVLDCLVSKATVDSEIFEALGMPREGRGWLKVQEAAAACVVQVRSGPRFAEDLQRAAGGKLTEKQAACAAREYGELSPEQIEAAAGAVMNPEQAKTSATAPIEEIYDTCGIEPAGG